MTQPLFFAEALLPTGWARNVLMYAMNEAAKDKTNGDGYRPRALLIL